MVVERRNVEGCLHITGVEEGRSLKIVFVFQPLGPRVIPSMLYQQREVCKHGGGFLPQGASEVELDADLPVDVITNPFSHLKK